MTNAGIPSVTSSQLEHTSSPPCPFKSEFK